MELSSQVKWQQQAVFWVVDSKNNSISYINKDCKVCPLVTVIPMIKLNPEKIVGHVRHEVLFHYKYQENLVQVGRHFLL